MVHQITHTNVVDLEVCSISYQRHCTSLLKKRGKIANTLSKKTAMAENTETRNPLPVVELRPFSKKVWRREKSLPDFYEKKKSDEANSTSNTNNVPDNDASGTRLIREMTETRRSIETRQNTFDSALGKYRNHPKAEFLHESNKAWRKQDLIPSFITRFERTKTSLETLSRDNTIHRINLENTSMFENALKRELNPMIKIKGGKMNQQIQRRHLLYLNPLDTYRQPNSWQPHFNSTSNSRQTTTRDKLILSSRHSIPLTSSRTRDLLLGDSHAQYPLKPIRREDMESPHKFNSKLGAAKNSLEVLSKVGIQTKLEKALEKEMEWNMEKFRKDRLLFTNDLRGVPFQCFNVDSNLTVGEMSLKTAREANKLSKTKQRQFNARKINAFGTGLRGSDFYNKCTSDPGTPRLPNAAVVNPVLHPIGHTLMEETETRASSDSTLIATHKLVGRGRDQNQTGSAPLTKDNEISSNDLLQSNNLNATSIGNSEFLNSSKVSNTLNARQQGIDDLNNNSNTVISKEGLKGIDSSRIETNVEYLENLQMKSSLGYHPSSNATPTLDLTQTADKSHPTSTDEAENGIANNDQQLTPSQHSEYTSHRDQSLLQSQRVSPHTVANSPSSQQVNHQPHSHQHSEQHSPQHQDPIEWLNNAINPQESSVSNGIKPQNITPTELFSNSSETIYDTHKPATTENITDNRPTKSEAVPIENERRQPVVEINNSSPLTSSGFESQPTTDQEDDLSPSSDQHEVFKEDAKDKSDSAQIDLSGKNIQKAQPTAEVNDPKITLSSGNDKVVVDPERQVDNALQNDSSVLQDSTLNEEKKGMVAVITKENQPPPINTLQGKMVTNYTPEIDEGIGLVPTEAAVLDSSVTEICSEQGVPGSADNGDSGISTTFLTSEDSVPEQLQGVVMS